MSQIWVPFPSLSEEALIHCLRTPPKCAPFYGVFQGVPWSHFCSLYISFHKCIMGTDGKDYSTRHLLNLDCCSWLNTGFSLTWTILRREFHSCPLGSFRQPLQSVVLTTMAEPTQLASNCYPRIVASLEERLYLPHCIYMKVHSALLQFLHMPCAGC